MEGQRRVMHRLTLEDILVKPLQLSRLPRCLTGKRACPPEDIGGVYGYGRALPIVADPVRFDLEAVHADLVASFADKLEELAETV